MRDAASLRERALEHPKRQAIFHYVQQNPGANFREVVRRTSIPAGTVRHHLTVLQRSGHLVERPHRSTIRLFENRAFDQAWHAVVLLREPALAGLHAWLKANPGSAQKDVLEGMEAAGWSRSTTQHRLSRLVEAGLVSLRLQGRLKIYAAAEPTAAPSQGLARPSLSMAVGFGVDGRWAPATPTP